MKVKHILIIGCLIFFLLPISLSLTTVNAQQLTEIGLKGSSHLKLLEVVETLSLDDKLLVWIDINATVDCFGDYYLPADPSLYGIKWAAITFAPNINESRLFWCLAEVQAKDVEKLLEIPWVFDITMVRVGGLSNETSVNPKLSSRLQEAIDRAMQYNSSLEVIIWMQSSSSLLGADGQAITKEIVHNVTATIEQLGGCLLRDHYNGSITISAYLPAKNISRLTENLFVKKLYLNGPIIPQGVDKTASLYGFGKTKGNINLYHIGLIAFLLLTVPNIAMSEKKTKKNILVFLLASVLSLAFILQMTSSIQALDISTSAIRATDVWTTGNRGEGVNIAVIDTGIDLNHPDFINAIVAQINIPDMSGNVQDLEGHGTHVAGIVAGRGINNPIYCGVAWGAGLVIVRVTTNAHLAVAVQWIRNNRVQFNIRVIQSSVSPSNVGLGGDGLDSPYAIVLDDAVEDGIVVVQAAGNSGNQGSRTIESPGNAFNVITVGAVDDMNTVDISDDNLAYYPNGYTYKGINYPPWGSSRGPTGDGRPKPDVVASGVHIWSTASATALPGYYEDVAAGGYGELSGTSMAAPHVAGAVALMLNATPNLTPAQVKAILRQTARLNNNLNEFSVNDRGQGIIDANASVQLAQNVDNIQRGQMYDSWNISTPIRYLDWDDYLTFTMDAPSSTFGIGISNVEYHYKVPIGFYIVHDLMNRLSAQHVWIDGIYYHLGNNMHRYLFSGPRVCEKSSGYVNMSAQYRVGNVTIKYYWYMHVDSMSLQLLYTGGSSWKTLMYVDINVWNPTNYPYLPSTSETVLIERKIADDGPLAIRELDCDEYVQINPNAADNPIMWILRPGYFGNNPDAPTVMNNEYVYNRDIAIYYQGASNYTGGCIYRVFPYPELPAPNPTQNDAGTGGDAGNTFSAATSISSGSYTGILCNSESDNGNDYYKFNVASGQYIYASMTSPCGINFDLQLYDPSNNLKAGSYLGGGITDSVFFKANSTGQWRIRINTTTGEAQYSFYLSINSNACAMKTKTDGYFYVPNATDLLKIEMLFDNQKLIGDQTGPTAYPDGKVDMIDLYFIITKFGINEGGIGWDYMADINPDRKIDMIDQWWVSKNYGYAGNYPPLNLTGVTVKFNTDEEKSPDSYGFVTIPQGATNFNVTRNGTPIGAMIIFWEP